MTPGGPLRLALQPVGEAVERLAAPGALESFSPLFGSPLLAVDLRVQGRFPEPEAIAAARGNLPRMACVTLGVGAADALPAAAPFLGAFDVLPRDDAELEAIRRGVERSPLASLALVQLLRHSAELSVHEGLIAESLVYSMLQAGPEFARWRDAREPKQRPVESEPAVLVTRSGDTLRLTLNRPKLRNAFSASMRDALVEGLTVALADPALLEIVIDGSGLAFCSGGDLDEFGSFPDPATAHAVRSTRNPARLLADCAGRVRAELHGACVGAGAELPAFVRRVVASRDSFFQLPEVAMGLVPGAGGTVSLPRRIGRERTAWLALGGERIDAATALEYGLVDELRSD